VDLFSFAALHLREKKSAAADSPSRKGAKKGRLIILCGSATLREKNRSRQVGKTQRRKEKSLCGLAPLREFNKKYTLVKKDSLPQAGLVPSLEEIRRGGLPKQVRRRGAKKNPFAALRLCESLIKNKR
jgi:hypothetical protein